MGTQPLSLEQQVRLEQFAVRERQLKQERLKAKRAA